MTETTTEVDRTSVDALFRNFGRLLRDGTATILVPWMVIAAIDLGFVVVAVVVGTATGAFDGGGAGLLVQLINVVQVVLIMSLRVALLYALREVAFHGPSAVGNTGAVVRGLFERFGPAMAVTLVVGALVSVGLALCILPGLAAMFFLAFAPYLVVGRKLPVGESLRTSAQWARSEWLLVLTTVVVAVLAVGVVGCVTGAIAGLIPDMTAAAISGYVGAWVMSTILGYLAFVWWGAAYVTADDRQQAESLRQTAPEPYEAHSSGDDRDSPASGSPSTYEPPSDEGGE